MAKRTRVLMLGPGLDVKGGVSSVEKLIIANLSDSIEVKLVPTMLDGSFAKKAFVFVAAFVRTLVLLIRGWPQVVHIHFTTGASNLRKTIFARLCKLFRRRVILHGHAAEFHLFIPTLRGFYRRWTMGTIHSANCLICLSRRWRQFFTELGVDDKKVVVMPNPVVLPNQLPDRAEKPVVQFVFLGEIGHRKGAFDIVSAIGTLPAGVRERIRLVMAGKGEVDALRDQINEAKLDSVITLVDWVGPEERDELLAESDALLLPSYNEGLPMSMLEAMSFGLPVITTPVGGIPEYVQNDKSGILIEPGDVQALADAIQRLADDASLRRRIGMAGYESVRPLDIRDYCSRLERIYESVVATGAPPEL